MIVNIEHLLNPGTAASRAFDKHQDEFSYCTNDNLMRKPKRVKLETRKPC